MNVRKIKISKAQAGWEKEDYILLRIEFTYLLPMASPLYSPVSLFGLDRLVDL